MEPKDLTPERPDDPPWLKWARAELGVREVPGEADNPRILEYQRCTSMGPTHDETPWCSAFACWVMEKAGIVSPRLANARSWLKWGDALTEPRHGCVIVFSAPARGPHAGHVGFWLDKPHGSGFWVRVLGGNQGNEVREALYPAASVIGWRWPKRFTGAGVIV